MEHFQDTKKFSLRSTKPYKIVKQPHILEGVEYYELMRQLNTEQSSIVTDVITRKLYIPDELIFFLLTGGAGTGKTHTTKEIFQSLVCIHNVALPYNKSLLIGIVTAYTGKVSFNAGGVTLHFAFYFPFNKADYLSLKNEKLDTLSKHFQQLCVILIDEASLVGATTLYQIDKRLRKILHTPTSYFGNVDMIFSSDFYQANPVRDSLIFENPKINKNTIPYNFWLDKIKFYQLHIEMRQKDPLFIDVLNRMRLNMQTDQDIAYVNNNYYRIPPLSPVFPYIFYRNKYVHIHNAKMLSLTKGEKIMLVAIDNYEIPGSSYFSFDREISFPSTITVKQNMLVELYGGNYNTNHGLVNGAEWIFKSYSSNNNRHDIVWIEFSDPEIGKQQRSRFKQLYDINILPNWTPIFRIEKSLSMSHNKLQITIRK